MERKNSRWTRINACVTVSHLQYSEIGGGKKKKKGDKASIKKRGQEKSEQFLDTELLYSVSAAGMLQKKLLQVNHSIYLLGLRI